MKLGLLLTAYQQKHDIDGKTLAADIGITESQLTRIKKGKTPDTPATVQIITWMFGA